MTAQILQKDASKRRRRGRQSKARVAYWQQASDTLETFLINKLKKMRGNAKIHVVSFIENNIDILNLISSYSSEMC